MIQAPGNSGGIQTFILRLVSPVFYHRAARPKPSSATLTDVWWNMSLWERMLRHQRKLKNSKMPNLIDSLFVLLICIAKNTQVFNFNNGHLWPTPLSFLSNTMSLTPLIRCSLSLSLCLLLHLFPTLFHLWYFHINTPLILWDRIIWKNLIKWTRLFHLGIAHNRWLFWILTIYNESIFWSYCQIS